MGSTIRFDSIWNEKKRYSHSNTFSFHGELREQGTAAAAPLPSGLATLPSVGAVT